MSKDGSMRRCRDCVAIVKNLARHKRRNHLNTLRLRR